MLDGLQIVIKSSLPVVQICILEWRVACQARLNADFTVCFEQGRAHLCLAVALSIMASLVPKSRGEVCPFDTAPHFERPHYRYGLGERRPGLN